MIRKLKIRLTAIFTLLTSLILMIALLLTLSMNFRDYMDAAERQIQSNLSKIEDHLNSSQVIKDSYLSSEEINNSCVIFILENDTPLYFNGAYVTGEERNQMLTDFKSKNNKSRNKEITNTQSSILTDLINGETYLTRESHFLREQDSEIRIIYFQDTALLKSRLFKLCLNYFLLLLGGMILLGFVSFLLVSLSLIPTKEAMKAQNEFIAAASHELRSPLTVIRANLSLLNNSSSKEETEKLISASSKEVDRLKHLTDHLLTLTNLDANTQPVTLRETATDALFIELYENFYPLCRENEHPLSITLPDEELPYIYSDSETLKQLLGIFIQNAISHTKKGASIEMKAQIKDKNLILSVIDHGEGIPDSEKSKIFKRFYRGDASRSNKGHYGLGLSIAENLSEVLHCKIKLTDTPGGGATFLLEFAPSSFCKNR